MNILVDSLPDAVEIEGKIYEINTDFRAVINIILAFDDIELAAVEKQAIMLSLLYKDSMQDEHVVQAFDLAKQYMVGPASGQEDTAGSEQRYYSFTKDSALIYAAFQQTHGIDLQKSNLHWWQFLALFSDLGSDTVFCQLVSLRKRVAQGDASKEEIKMSRRLGSAFEVDQPVRLTVEEMEAERKFFELVNKRKEKTNAT